MTQSATAQKPEEEVKIEDQGTLGYINIFN